MPKEFIANRWFGQYATQVDEIDGDQRVAVPLDEAMIKIGWADDHVEIAIAHPDVPTDSPLSEFEARHVQMDRVGVQKLIKTLRRARDRAWGADE